MMKSFLLLRFFLCFYLFICFVVCFCFRVCLCLCCCCFCCLLRGKSVNNDYECTFVIGVVSGVLFCFVLFVCGVVVFLHNYVLAASVQYFIFYFLRFPSPAFCFPLKSVCVDKNSPFRLRLSQIYNKNVCRHNTYFEQ